MKARLLYENTSVILTRLLGLMFASVPSINSLHSVFMCLHRPLIHGEMVRVRNEQIRDKLKQHNIAHSGPINGSTIALLPEGKYYFRYVQYAVI
jgi:hypothetical protein